MKKALPLVVLSSLLVLASCVDPKVSSTDTDTSTSDSSLSTISGTSSTSSVTTTPPAPVGYTDEEKMMIESVIGKHDIPYVNMYGVDIEYSIFTDVTTQGDGALIVHMEDVDAAILDDIVNVHKATGHYEDVDIQGVPENMRVLMGEYDDGTVIQLQASSFTPDGEASTEGVGVIQIAYIGLNVAFDTFPKDQLELKTSILYELGDMEIDIPAIDTAKKYLLVELVDTSYDPYPGLIMDGIKATDYGAVLKKAGWNDQAIDYYGSDSYYYISPDNYLGIITWDVQGQVYVQVILNSLITEWPTDLIATAFEELGIAFTGTVPAPVGDFLYYTIMADTWFMAIYLDAYLPVGADGKAALDNYVKALLDAGYTALAYIDQEYYYADPDKVILICPSYDSETNALNIFIQPCAPNYTTAWPTEIIAGWVENLSGGLTTATVPAPTFDWDFGTMYDNTLYNDGYNIDLQDVAEDGTFVKHAADYIAQLNAADSGWTYDPYAEVWYDTATKKVAISVLDDPDYGTSIYIKPYLPYDTELTAESIGEHLTESGIENVDQVPVYAGGEAYLFSTSTQTVTIDIAATNADEVAAYEALLLEKGYILREAYDYKIYEDAGKTIILQIALDPTDSTRAQIIIQAHDIWLADVEEMTSMLSLIALFTGIVIPFPETIAWAEGTVGYDLGTTFDEKYYTYYVIFDTSFADKLGEDLVALGWAKKDAASVGFTTTYEYVITAADTGEQISYYVDILVDTEHGFSVVAIW